MTLQAAAEYAQWRELKGDSGATVHQRGGFARWGGLTKTLRWCDSKSYILAGYGLVEVNETTLTGWEKVEPVPEPECEYEDWPLSITAKGAWVVCPSEEEVRYTEKRMPDSMASRYPRRFIGWVPMKWKDGEVLNSFWRVWPPFGRPVFAKAARVLKEART